MAVSLSQLDKRQQMTIAIAAPAALVLILGWLTWSALKTLGPDPALPRLLQRPGGHWAQIEAKNAEIAKYDAVIKQGPDIELKIAGLQKDIAHAEERLPKEAEKAEMRQLIEKMAHDIPTTMGTVQFRAVKIREGQVPKGEEYQPIAYETEISGDLNGIIKYVDQIEKNTRFMAVRNLRVRPGGVSLDKESGRVVAALHEVTMEIVTYVYNPEQAQKKKGTK